MDYENVNENDLLLISTAMPMLWLYAELLRSNRQNTNATATYMEETHVLLHTPIIIIHFS